MNAFRLHDGALYRPVPDLPCWVAETMPPDRRGPGSATLSVRRSCAGTIARGPTSPLGATGLSGSSRKPMEP